MPVRIAQRTHRLPSGLDTERGRVFVVRRDGTRALAAARAEEPGDLGPVESTKWNVTAGADDPSHAPECIG